MPCGMAVIEKRNTVTSTPNRMNLLSYNDGFLNAINNI
jgi:hypothetical protein